MIFCKNCGTQVDDNAKVCPACGQPVEDTAASFDNAQTYDPYANQQFAQQPPMYDPNAQQGYNQQGYGQPNYGAPMGNMGFPERNLVTCIILSLVTCGIYGLYWFYCLTEDSNKLSNEPNPTSGGMAILLSIVTCGIYELYWMYKRGELIDQFNASHRGQQTSNAVLYLVLSVCAYADRAQPDRNRPLIM